MSLDWQLRLRALRRALLAILRAALGLASMLWTIVMRLPARARAAVVLATLIVGSGMTASAAPSLSVTASGLAVLLVAGCGLWLIVSPAFRRRHW